MSRVCSALINDGVQPSTSLPIVPLTAGGLLIPFQPSDPSKGPAPRSNLRNFDRIQQQIQNRAQLLAALQQQNVQRTPSLPIHSPNRVDPTPLFSRNYPRPGPEFTPNVSASRPLFSSSVPNSPLIPSNISQPPPIIRSQTPYTSGNAFGSSSSSSSSSSKSSASSALPRPNTQSVQSNQFYSGPPSTNIRGDSVISGPSAPYQSLRP